MIESGACSGRVISPSSRQGALVYKRPRFRKCAWVFQCRRVILSRTRSAKSGHAAVYACNKSSNSISNAIFARACWREQSIGSDRDGRIQHSQSLGAFGFTNHVRRTVEVQQHLVIGQTEAKAFQDGHDRLRVAPSGFDILPP